MGYKPREGFYEMGERLFQTRYTRNKGEVRGKRETGAVFGKL